MNDQKSVALYQKAIKVIPGGVNSPVRACKSVGANPLFIDRANGCIVKDMDGNTYIDYVGSWGPMILGHRNPVVLQAIAVALERGTSFGASTDLEVELAQMIVDAVPSVDKIRMVNSGTEATMSAIRLARGFTERSMIIKFDGCYHGHADTLLVAAGSGVATLGIPGSPGVPEAMIQETLSLPYNDIDQFKETMAQHGASVACVIVEPVAGNMGMVPPVPGFLETVREVTRQYESLLIFDEVMTGFRVAYGGAQNLYQIEPDLSCFGKVIGGGLPVGAYGGREAIMDFIAPDGPVYQAGTLSGNPVAMAAGIATLKQLNDSKVYATLYAKTEQLVEGLKAAIRSSGVEAVTNHVGSMFGLFFTDQPVTDFESAKKSHIALFPSFYNQMLAKGIYLAPSPFEAGFVSTAHKDEHIEKTIAAAEKTLKAL